MILLGRFLARAIYRYTFKVILSIYPAKHNGWKPQVRRINLLWITTLIAVAVGSVAGTALYIKAFSKQRLMVSTTTSLFDTGLLDLIETQFESKYPIDLCFISVGTGLAITHAKRGDADLILVHSPTQENQFLTEGYGFCRKIIAYNYFAIIGPNEDPAKINGLTNPILP